MRKPKNCPLTLHATGQWCKHVKGKMHYFGKDLEKALVKWVEKKDSILAGKPKPQDDGRATVQELGNLYHARCVAVVAAGELTQRSLEEATKSIRKFISIVGAQCRPDELRPLDFAKIKAELFEPVKRTKGSRGGGKGRTVARRSAVTVAGDIRRIRAFLSWCSDSEHVAPMRWAKEFRPSTTKATRVAKQKRELIPLAKLRQMIEAAPVCFSAILLLAINTGMGPQDIADIELDSFPSLDSKDVWLNSVRSKTGVSRRAWLWPETVEAIQKWLAIRPHTTSPLLFVTKQRKAWVRDTDNAISKAFASLRDEHGLSDFSFYDLRRAFQTVGARSGHQRVVSYIMGHAVGEADMGARYTVEITDESIELVCNHVRKWLFDSKVK